MNIIFFVFSVLVPSWETKTFIKSPPYLCFLCKIHSNILQKMSLFSSPSVCLFLVGSFRQAYFTLNHHNNYVFFVKYNLFFFSEWRNNLRRVVVGQPAAAPRHLQPAGHPHDCHAASRAYCLRAAGHVKTDASVPPAAESPPPRRLPLPAPPPPLHPAEGGTADARRCCQRWNAPHELQGNECEYYFNILSTFLN